MNYGWAGTIEQFKELDLKLFIKQLQYHVYKINANDSKIASQREHGLIVTISYKIYLIDFLI